MTESRCDGGVGLPSDGADPDLPRSAIEKRPDPGQ
jgi:hypothetical protein